MATGRAIIPITWQSFSCLPFVLRVAMYRVAVSYRSKHFVDNDAKIPEISLFVHAASKFHASALLLWDAAIKSRDYYALKKSFEWATTCYFHITEPTFLLGKLIPLPRLKTGCLRQRWPRCRHKSGPVVFDLLGRCLFSGNVLILDLFSSHVPGVGISYYRVLNGAVCFSSVGVLIALFKHWHQVAGRSFQIHFCGCFRHIFATEFCYLLFSLVVLQCQKCAGRIIRSKFHSVDEHSLCYYVVWPIGPLSETIAKILQAKIGPELSSNVKNR